MSIMPSTSSDRLRELLGLMPFSEHLGIVLEDAEALAVVGSMAWSAERCTANGILHGGALMSLADSMGAVCAYLNLPDGASTATIESKINFFRAVRSGLVRATARPLHVGSGTIVVQTALVDDQEHSVALVIQTQAVLRQA